MSNVRPAAATRAKKGSAPRFTASRRPLPAVPPLENGDRLTTVEFLRRYEAMPSLKKAELVEGIVFMSPPVTADAHAEPDGLIQLWLGLYSIYHPGLKLYPNTTLVLDSDNTMQPDSILCSSPRPGGRVWLDDQGYLHGAPETVCEIAAGSASVDLHAKLNAYRRHGVSEYLGWLTRENTLHWFHEEDGHFIAQKPRSGRLVSRCFPGLVLEVKALLRGAKARLAARLADAAKS